MKIAELTDVAITCQDHPLVIELKNGHQLTTVGYAHGYDKRGKPIIIIKARRQK